MTAGCDRMQRWGGPVEEIRPGDVAWIAPTKYRERRFEMDYVKLGSTGLDVSPICLGCMSFGSAEG